MILSQISISIHAPREGSDPSSELKRIRKLLYFNPRSPRGERPPDSIGQRRGQCISIHAPREGSDEDYVQSLRDLERFQSTLPARGATVVIYANDTATTHFNPRSPRGERRIMTRQRQRATNFNPRSPRGERPRRTHLSGACRKFQSTLPARGATFSA